MRKLVVMLVIVLFGLSLCSDASARGRWRRSRYRSRSVSVGSVPIEYHTANDQRKCELEAKYMFDHGIRGHVFGLIGHYEGVGFAGPGCATCVPKRKMILSGDAVHGWARVRSWR